MVQKYVKSNKLEINLVKIAKIAIIGFMSFSVLGHFVPFFEGSNSYFYGMASILFIEEGITKSNTFLEKYETNEFLVENWLRTDQNEMIPMSGNGLIALGGIFYLFGGFFGLYYLSPILFIILLIISERTATSLFGKYAGLITLILLSTSNLLFRNSIQLHTETLYCLLFVLGTYFLIKFGRTNQSYFILIASTMFAFSSTVRLSGVISFPMELFILTIFIVNSYLKTKKIKNVKNQQNKKWIFTSLSLFVIPWIIFFIVFAYGNIITTGEPFVIYGTLNESYTEFFESSPSSLVSFEDTDFDNVIQYSKYLLPYIFPGAFNSIDNNFENILGNHWIGFLPLIILSLILIFSYKFGNKKLEVFVIIVFIFSTVWVYSAITSEELGDLGVPGRYMLPAFVLSSILFGYAIEQIFTTLKKNNELKSKVFQGSLVFVLFIFVIISFNFTPSVTMFEQDNYFKNPFNYEREFPLKDDSVKQNSIVLAPVGVRAQEYDLAAFRLITTNESQTNSIELLKNIIKNGSDVYTFKVPFSESEKNIISNLVEKYEFILKEHSSVFCKVELTTNKESTSDENCVNNKPIRNINQK